MLIPNCKCQTRSLALSTVIRNSRIYDLIPSFKHHKLHRSQICFFYRAGGLVVVSTRASFPPLYLLTTFLSFPHSRRFAFHIAVFALCFAPNHRFSDMEPSGSGSARNLSPEKCEICGQAARGYHYEVKRILIVIIPNLQVPSCNGCKTFFRRSILDKRSYKPCKFDQKCHERGSKLAQHPFFVLSIYSFQKESNFVVTADLVAVSRWKWTRNALCRINWKSRQAPRIGANQAIKQ